MLGFSGGIEVARVWGGDAIELRWPCPGCGRETTQETTALSSMADADDVKRDSLCCACRIAYEPTPGHASAPTTWD